MGRFIILILCATLSLCQGGTYNYVTKEIDMPLDHFNFNTNTTFKLRYLINETYFDRGPMFFYTGNEGDITAFAENTGFMWELAKKMNALVVFAEHRYYGKTLPFGDESYSNKNLGYLSAQQALADFVYLIDQLQQQYLNESSSTIKLPVIAFGGSYGGMLSAWLRMKYPYSVAGAIASSAPIWQFKDLTPCGDFYKIVTDVFKSLGSKRCAATIQKSWKILRNIGSNDIGKANLSQKFQLCSPLTTNDDIDSLLDWLNEIYVNIVMVNYPYPTDFLVPLPGNPVRELCAQMDSVEYNDDEGLTRAITKGLEVYTNYTTTTKCNNIKETSPNLGDQGWNYQSCTDMIMPMCTTDKDMFEPSTWDFQEVSDKCFNQFSVRPRSEDVPILEFGGKDISTASNIVFSNGLLDPWSSGGVMKNVSSSVVSIVIPDGAHHWDLRGSNELDTSSVKSARKIHEEHIRSWIADYYRDVLFNNDYLTIVRI